MTKEDYIGEDGLLHCGICDEAKEAYVPKELFFGKDRHARNCRCVREYHEAQKAESEQTRHLHEVDRLRRKCFQHSNYADATFQNSKVENKQSVFCQEYVKDWEANENEKYWNVVLG